MRYEIIWEDIHNLKKLIDSNVLTEKEMLRYRMNCVSFINEFKKLWRRLDKEIHIVHAAKNKLPQQQ